MSDLVMEHAQNTVSWEHLLGEQGAGGARMTRPELAELVDAVARQEGVWRAAVHHDPEQRWYGRLYRSQNVELWLIGWEQGQDTRFHDHGGSSGAFVVVQGRLSEEYGYVERWHGTHRRTHRLGRACSFGPEYVHNLGNDVAEPATSVHAYSPPLSTMTYYQPGRERLVPYETLATSAPDPEVDTARAAQPGGCFSAVVSQ
jgi:hypothetical protein